MTQCCDRTQPYRLYFTHTSTQREPSRGEGVCAVLLLGGGGGVDVGGAVLTVCDLPGRRSRASGQLSAESTEVARSLC